MPSVTEALFALTMATLLDTALATYEQNYGYWKPPAGLSYYGKPFVPGYHNPDLGKIIRNVYMPYQVKGDYGSYDHGAFTNGYNFLTRGWGHKGYGSLGNTIDDEDDYDDDEQVFGDDFSVGGLVGMRAFGNIKAWIPTALGLSTTGIWPYGRLLAGSYGSKLKALKYREH